MTTKNSIFNTTRWNLKPLGQNNLKTSDHSAVHSGFNSMFLSQTKNTLLTSSNTRNNKPTVLIMDNDPNCLILMTNLLNLDSKIKIVDNGEQVLKFAQSDSPPDIILLSKRMPQVDGYEVCKWLKTNSKTRDIPVIFLVEKNDAIDQELGINLGAVDFITKPISPAIFRTRIKTHLEMRKVMLNKQDANTNKDYVAELIATQSVIIQAMAYLAETRDTSTGNHIRRTQRFVKALAERLHSNPRFLYFLHSDGIINLLSRVAAPLHDIGKVEIPDRILLKPSALTKDEYDILKTHTRIGRDIILNAEKDLGVEIPFLKHVKDTIYYHHENWDGSGYPEGLVGNNIPIPARIMAVADAYDSMISKTVYKPTLTHEQAVKSILAAKGTEFDPDIVDAFYAIHEEFRQISEKYPDNEEDFKKKISYMEQALSIAP